MTTAHLPVLCMGLLLKIRIQVPLYYSSLAGYWVLQKLGGWMRSQQQENTNDGISERDLKRQAKKERKAAKGPKIRMR